MERTRKGLCRSDHCWNGLKGGAGETSERWVGVPMGFPEHVDTILS